MTRKRVTMLIPTLVQGGAEKQMSLLAAGLPRSEFDVSVVALTAGGPWLQYLQDRDIPVTVIGKRFKADPFALYRLVGQLRLLRPDVLHTWIFAANAYGRLAARWAGVRTCVVGERCVDLWKNELHFALDRWLDRRTDAYVTNSQGVVDFYQLHRVGLGKFHVIPNAIESIESDSPSLVDSDSNQEIRAEVKQARSEWRQKLDLPQSSLVVTSLARLWPQKRLKDLIWAMDLLNCQHDHVHLVIAGDGPERGRLEQFAREAKVEAHVQFVGHLQQPSSLLQASDLVALVSEYEGQSNAIMEAIRCRVPVLVSDIPGNRDLVPDESFGWLCQVGDRIGIAKKIQAVIHDSQSALQRAAAAQERLSRDFSESAMIESHIRLYRQLVP